MQSRLARVAEHAQLYARLDQTWVRLPRPDVTEAFAGNPLFADHLRPWEQQHGFIAFVPRQPRRSRWSFISRSSWRTRAALSCRSSSVTVIDR